MFIIDTLLGIGGKLVDRLVPDVNKKQDQDHEAQMGQISTNTEQAKSSNIFIAGARPFLMWSMGFAVVYKIVVTPFAKAFGLNIPEIDVGPAMQILIGLLGL